MSEPQPPTHDTPDDHLVIGLRIEAALLPGWFDEVRAVAAEYARRMAVVEKPDEWVVQVELPRDRVDAFRDALSERWAAYDQG